MFRLPDHPPARDLSCHFPLSLPPAYWFMPSAAGLPFVIIIVVVKSSESNNKVSGMRQKQKQTLNSNGFLLPTENTSNSARGLGKISCLHAALLCLSKGVVRPVSLCGKAQSIYLCTVRPGFVQQQSFWAVAGGEEYGNCFGNYISIIQHKTGQSGLR